MKNALWAASVLLIPVVSGWTASVTVKQSGGGDFTTIQAAINSGASTITIIDSAHYVENLEIGDPLLGGPAVTLTSNQTGNNRPVITPSANKVYVDSARASQAAGFGLFANNSVVSNLVIEAQPDVSVGAMMVMANNVVIEYCVFRIATNTLGTTFAAANPLLFLAQQGDGSGQLQVGNPTPGGRDCNGCVVRNCEFIGIAPDSDPVEPTADSQGYLGQRSNGTGTGQSSGYVRMDHITDGSSVSVTFEGCYFHHCRDYGIFPTNNRNGAGELNVFVKKCRFDAQAKFQVRGRGANVYVESSVFTRANQIRNGDEENSAVAIQSQSPPNTHIPSGSVSNCLFVNCGSANAQRAYYGGVNNPNGNLLAVDKCTFVSCVSGVTAGRTISATSGPGTLTVSNSIFHQIGVNVPLSIDKDGVALTNGHPDLVGGLYPAWTNGLANFQSPHKWSAVFNRHQVNTLQTTEIIIGNCLVGSIDTEDTRSWEDALAADLLDPTTSVTGARLFAGFDTNFVGAGTVTRATPAFVNTDADAPNAFRLAAGSPGQGLGADLAPVLAPRLIVSLAGNQVTINWSQPLWMTGYALQSTPSLSSPVWTTVPGVTNFTVNFSATVNNTGGDQFFAIRKL